MKKLTYDEVARTFTAQGCKLLTKTYKNSKQKLTYLCKCGHKRTTSLTHFKTYISQKKYNYTICKNCIIQKENRFKKNTEKMHPKTFQKIKKLMERRYHLTKKYRSDFYTENYNKTLTCWDCKKTKSIRLFPYRKQYKDNKEKRCKKCNAMNNSIRIKNYTIEQFANNMVISSKASSRKRSKNGRTECGINTITVKDILDLKTQQNNICVYSGRTLVWKKHHPNKASIDRIDSSKGYTTDNIQLVTHLVNQAKSNLNDNDFIQLIRDIYMYKVE